MAVARLVDWSIVGNATPYTAPEAITIHIKGNVYNHPNPDVPNGDLVTTSRVVDSSGVTVTTLSGTKYILGTINRDYLKYLKKSGLKYDPLNPVKVK